VALKDLNPRLRNNRHFKLALNVVPRHLLSAGFIETLRQAVVEARVSPRQVVLEVTERDEFADLAKAATVVAELREFGFRVAIDDVGVGHSGLSLIKGLGADTIKIDKIFVDTITRDNSAVMIVEMLVRLARELKMTVVAEGIETPEQMAALLACGVEEGQGYIVSPPLPFAKFDQLVESLQIINAAAADRARVRVVA
jgi:c-di-GMP phosphodiesterase